jgi:FMNH2-dependent dimethyl sulfone monooxygenase
MSLEFGLWSPVCGGWLRVREPQRETSPAQLAALAQLAERLGYDLYYVPEHYLNAVYGPEHDVADAWVISAAAVALTQRIRIVTAVQPGFKAPGVVAKMGATLQRFRPNAFGLGLLAGWWQLEAENHGDRWLPHADRYARTAEYLDVIRRFWTEPAFDHQGEYFQVKGGILEAKPQSLPLVFVAGESDAALQLAARSADVLFVNGAAPEQIAAIASRAKSLAKDRYGRSLRVAMSAFGLVRPTLREAQAHVDAWKARADLQLIAYFRQQIDGAVVAHNRGSEADQIEANLGLTAGLVGDPRTIVDRLRAFEIAGVDAVIVKLEPSATEAERFARDVMEPYRSLQEVSLDVAKA